MLKRLFLTFALCLSQIVYAAETDKVVNSVMQQYMQKYQVPGAAVIVYVDGKPSTYYFGVADKQSNKPVSKDTIFELGSLTKLMTAILLAQDVDFAKIKLKDPVNKYIPTLPASFGNISMRSLATHTSGLPFKPAGDIKTREQLEQYAQTFKPDTAPDTKFQYSNFGIGLIGFALETVSHQNYNQLFRTKILTPLGMSPIAFSVPKKYKDFYAQGYDEKGAPAPRIGDNLFAAAGDMKASVSDMGKFLSAAIGLPQTPESIFYPMRMTQTPYLEVGDYAQGLGWQIHDTTPETVKVMLTGNDMEDILKPVAVGEVFKDPIFNGANLIDKTGATDGFRTYIAVIPQKKTGIVILTNRRVLGSPIAVAGREILFKLNGLS